jgi:enolase
MKIKNISSQKILNSDANWTIQTTLTDDYNNTGIFSVAGGLSKGSREATSISADNAIEIINDIKDDILGKDFKNQNEFDKFLIEKDGTDDKSELGANTVLSLSGAFCKTEAKFKKLELYEHIHSILNPDIPLNDIKFAMPKMMVLIFEGGLHGSGEASIQEFMAICGTIPQAVEIYKKAKKLLHEMGQSTNLGAEGAFSPAGMDNNMVLDTLTRVLKDEQIALDVAANSFEELKKELPNYAELIADYNILSIEDPFPENSWTEWENFYRNFHSEIITVTDDLTTTNPEHLTEALRRNCANGIIIKPNQIGTISETLEVIKTAQNNDWNVIVSHRGTDTNDEFIADLAVGAGAQYTKFGAPARGERVAKYNRLLEIQKQIN